MFSAMADRLRVAARGVSFSSQIDNFFFSQTQLKRLFEWEYTERCDTYKSRLWSQPIGQQLPLAPVRSLNSVGMDSCRYLLILGEYQQR